MKYIIHPVFLLWLLFNSFVNANEAPADIIFTHAAVYTLNKEQPWAQAVAVRDKKIIAVGNNADIEKLAGTNTRIVQLDGKMLLPGFHDSHVHPVTSGVEALRCALYDFKTVEAILTGVKNCAATKKDNEWIIGGGWLLSLFPANGPSKELLDNIVPDHPVYLTGIDGHSGWANSKALALAGINKDTPNPEGGIIERNSETGEASGTLRESAMLLVEGVMPAVIQAERMDGLHYGLQLANSLGITSLIDAAAGEGELHAYSTLDQQNKLTAHVVASIEYGTSFNAKTKDRDALVTQWAAYKGNRFRANSIKLFVDGVLEGETAALLEPYLGAHKHTGPTNFTPAQLKDIVMKYDALGIQVHMHAIGDRAVREGLDAFAAALRQNGKHDNRHHISHLQLIHPDDIPRFSELGVAANFQALWAFPDGYIVDLNLPVVGQERVNRMYPIGSMYRSGGMIVGGSDWSVSSMDPLMAIETAVTREDPEGIYPGTLNKNESVDLATMLAVYTLNGAWLMHQEDITGSIETGKLADLIVLDKNLFKIPAKQIHTTKVLHTFLEGKEIYQAVK